MDENMKTKRSNVELGLKILVFYTNTPELAEILVKKMGWHGMICLLK